MQRDVAVLPASVDIVFHVLNIATAASRTQLWLEAAICFMTNIERDEARLFRRGLDMLGASSSPKTRSCPPRSREEIVNACGVDDFHDGVNYTRTSCVIAVSKAKDMFEPFLHQVHWCSAYDTGRHPIKLCSLQL